MRLLILRTNLKSSEINFKRASHIDLKMNLLNNWQIVLFIL